MHFLMPTLSTFPTEKTLETTHCFAILSRWLFTQLLLHLPEFWPPNSLGSLLPLVDGVGGGRNRMHKNCNPSGSPLSESLGRQQTRTQNGHLQLNSSGGINAHWLCALPLLYQRDYFSTLRNRKTLETTQCFATFSTFASPGWIGWRAGETRSRVTIKCDPLG